MHKFILKSGRVSVPIWTPIPHPRFLLSPRETCCSVFSLFPPLDLAEFDLASGQERKDLQLLCPLAGEVIVTSWFSVGKTIKKRKSHL